MPDKVTGRVKWFNPTKGYGFVVPNDKTMKDVFVHYSAIVGDGYKSLKEGDVVEFLVTPGKKGLQATDVILLTQE